MGEERQKEGESNRLLQQRGEHALVLSVNVVDALEARGEELARFA